MKDTMNKVIEVLKAISSILAAIILIAGQLAEIVEKTKVLKETFTNGSTEPAVKTE